MPEFTILFEKRKETKNCAVFDEKPEAGKPPVIGTLYVQKWAAGSAETVQVKVVVG